MVPLLEKWRIHQRRCPRSAIRKGEDANVHRKRRRRGEELHELLVGCTGGLRHACPVSTHSLLHYAHTKLVEFLGCHAHPLIQIMYPGNTVDLLPLAACPGRLLRYVHFDFFVEISLCQFTSAGGYVPLFWTCGGRDVSSAGTGSAG